MIIHYGVQITTGQTDLTDYDLGLVAGVFRWINGRPNIDGWKQGIVTDDSFSEVTQEIEIAAGGSYATMSGFTCTIRNHDGLWKRLKDLGVNLIQKEVIFYTIRDGVFTQDWTGVVADTSFDELVFHIKCMDAFRAIHKPKLTKPIDTDRFPEATESAIGKYIPVCLGYVTKAPLINVSGTGQKTVLVNISGVDKTLCAAKGSLSSAESATGLESGSHRALGLYTKGVTFVENDSQLVGFYLSVVAGGTEQLVRIQSNIATNGGTEITYVVLDEPLDLTIGYVAWSSPETPANVWVFEVVPQNAVLIASNRNIKSVELNSDGQYGIFYWNDSAKEYQDFSEIQRSVNLADIESLGHPGILVISKTADSEGNIPGYFKIVPSDIRFNDIPTPSFTIYDGPNTQGDSQPNLFDEDRSTYYLLHHSASGLQTGSILFDVDFPLAGASKEFEDVYILIDFSHRKTSLANTSGEISTTVTARDLYEQVSDSSGLPDNTLLYTTIGLSPDIGTTFADVFTLPGLYYNESENPEGFYTRRQSLKITTLIDSIKKSVAYPSLRVELIFLALNYEAKLIEIGFVGKKSIALNSGTLYSKIKGEVFESTWGDRKTSGAQIENIADFVEYVIRVYDEFPEKVDTDSFDLLSDPSTGTRKDWFLGRSVNDNDSYNICDELCRFGFFGIIPKNNGKRALKTWLEDSDSVANHSDTNGSIIQGSIGPREPTPLSYVYNDIPINYAYNPGSDKFDKFYHITNIDHDAFPDEGDPTWKTYAVGFTDDQYDLAAGLWAKCHSSWVKYGVVRKIPDDMSNCTWFPDLVGEWNLTQDNNTALLYLTQLCSWTPFRKDIVTYHIANTEDNAALELLDKITFNDTALTDGDDEIGWIVRKTIVPGNGKDGKDYIEIGLMLDAERD